MVEIAERSVSTRLTLKIANFLAGAKDAQRSLGDLNRKFVETAGFASGFRKKLDDAFKKLPKIELDANSTPAEVKIAELRSRLETLRDKKVGVDIDAGAALAEMNMIQRELAAIDDREISFEVRAGVSGAMADLGAVNAEINRLDGRDATVNVNADVSGAMRGIAMVGAAMAALAAAPAIVSIAGAGLALGGAFGAAGVGAAGMAAVALPALGRVNEALKQQESAAGGAGGATKSLAQKQAEAAASALRLAQAQERVRKANEQVKDAARGVVQAQADVKRAQADVATAAEAGAARVADSVRRVSDAERQYSDAVRASRDAQQGLNDARRQAARDLEDLATRLTGNQLDLRSANLDLADAKKRLDAVRGNKSSSAADIERATIAYEQAQLRVKELTTSVQRLGVDKAEADAKGVEGSDLVKSAQDRLAAANQQVADSQRAIADAQADVAQAQTEAARGVAAAQERVAAAQEKLIDAQRRYSDAQRDAIMAERQLKLEKLQQKAATEQAGAAAGGAASKMAELSKEERALAKDIKAFQDEYKAWQQSLEGDVFPVISKGLDLVSSQLPRISPLVKTAAASFQVLEDDAAKALKAPFWGEFLYDLNTEMPGAIIGLGRTAGNVFTGMAGVLDAFLPHTGSVVDGLEKGSQRFSEWGQKLKDSPDFKAFIEFVKTEGPKVGQVIEDLAVSLGHTGVALIPLGVSALDGLGLLAKLTRDMDPEQIRAIAIAVGLIYAAMKVGGAVTAGLDALSSLRDRAAQVKDAASGASGKLASIGQAAGIAAGVVVATTALHELAKEASGANISVEGLTSSMERFSKTGRITGDLATGFGKDLKGSGLLVEGFGDSLRRTFDPTFLDRSRTAFTDTIKSMTFGVADLDSAAEKFENVDKALAGMVDAGNVQGAQEGFRLLAKHAADAGVPIEGLKAQLPEYAEALGAATTRTGTAADAIKGMGGATDEARRKMDDFTTSVSTFTSKTDVQAAVAGLASKYRDVKTALDEAGGRLDFTAKMTDKQREAVVKAREKFSDYLGSVDALGKKQADLARSTGDAAGAESRQRLAIAESLPKLFELAGKNKEAKDQVLLLAKAYGISREDALKAAGGAKGFKEVLDKIKSKDIRVGLDTSKAKEQLNKLIRDIATATANAAASINKAIKKPQRAGGIEAYRAGGVEAYAAGGVRSTPPMMATSPTILMGEGADKEAFIPYERQYRSRAEMLLSQVAADFGLQLLPADNVASAVQSASSTLSGSLSETGSTLLSTLGGAGSLTSAVDELGTAADGLAGTMLEAINRLADQIDALDASIDALSAAVSASRVATTASSAAAKASSSSKGRVGTAVSTTAKPRIGSAVSTTAKKTSSARVSDGKSTAAKKTQAKKTTKPGKVKIPIVGSGAGPSKPKSEGVFIEPLEPMAWGGLVTSPTILAGEAGKEMVIPLDPSKQMRGLDLLRQAAQAMGQDVAPKRSVVRSRPIQGGTPAASTVTPEMIEQIVVKMTGARRTGTGRTLHIENYHEAQGGSARQTAEELNLIDRRG